MHLDWARWAPLTYRASSLVLVLEGLMVITVLTLVVLGNQLNASVIFWRISPVDVTIAAVWFAGIYLIGKTRIDLPWQAKGSAPGSQQEPRGHSIIKTHKKAVEKGMGMQKIIFLFVVCSLVTLAASSTALLRMITKATLEDVSTLNKLINSAYRGESSKKGWTTEANLLEGSRTTEKELTEIIQDQKNTILKFTENNQIIGSVLLIEKEHQLYLGMLTVSPELQNSGVGKKLLQQAEIHASALGLTKIVMTVISVREELISWYKRNGYIAMGAREPFPVGDVHIPISNHPLEFIVLEKRIQ